MKRLVELGMVGHVSNLSIWETEVGHEFEANLGYRSRLYLKTNKAKMRELAMEKKHVPGKKGSIHILGAWWDSARQTWVHIAPAVLFSISQGRPA